MNLFLQFGIKCHLYTRSLHKTNCIYFAILLPPLSLCLFFLKVFWKGKCKSFASIFFYVTPVSSKAEWMIHVLKQSMLTYIFHCLLLVRYILLYKLSFWTTNVHKRKKMKKSCIKEELIYKSEIKKNKREEKSCQRVEENQLTKKP